MTGLVKKLRERINGFALSSIAGINNAFVQLKSREKWEPSGFAELDEITARSLVGTDISDHLIVIFVESIALQPKLIVELGVRGGESTFVFERTARLCGSNLVSVDIHDCHGASHLETWHFVRKDDVLFASEFAEWCQANRTNFPIDVLFIDTSHLFEHTLKEFQSWFPFLSANAKVILHDTNMNVLYRRRNGTMGVAWNNDRGVIRALEVFLDRKFNETTDFIDYHKGWLIKHYHHSLGLTVLQRFELPEKKNHQTPSGFSNSDSTMSIVDGGVNQR